MNNYFSARDILEKAIGTDAYFQIKSILTSTKAADVVEVVRCRECAKSTKGGASYVLCHGWGRNTEMPLDGFCSKGQRKEAEQSDAHAPH